MLRWIRDFLGIIKLGSCFIKSQTGRVVIWPPIYFVHKIAQFYPPIDRSKHWVSHLVSYGMISLIIINKSTTRVGWLALLEASHFKFKVWHFWSGQGYCLQKTSQGYCLLLYILYIYIYVYGCVCVYAYYLRLMWVHRGEVVVYKKILFTPATNVHWKHLLCVHYNPIPMNQF